MAKRSDAKTARVRAYLEDNPQATTAAVCKALKRYGVNSKDVAEMRARLDMEQECWWLRPEISGVDPALIPANRTGSPEATDGLGRGSPQRLGLV